MNATEKAKFDELTAKVTELEETVNTEQQQIADDRAQKEATIATLTQTVADLQAIIDAGGTDNTAEIQAVLDKVQGTIDDIKSTIADTPPVEPPVEPV